MSVSRMILNGDWPPDLWPAVVFVGHKGEGDGKAYVPVRTCRDTDYDTESVTCSECGAYVFDCPTVRFCPGCGSRVVVE